MSKPLTRKPLNARDVYSSVITDEDFETAIEQRHDLPLAFSRTALTLMELGTTESGYRTQAADRLHVAATIDEYVGAQLQLALRVNADRRHSPQKKDLKLKIIEFNHALSQMIDNDPPLTFNEVLRYLDGMFSAVRPQTDGETRQIAHGNFECTLRGMRDEIIAEQIACSLGYEVEGTTPEDELRGIDRFLVKDGERIPIDVKCSETSAIKARAADTNGRVYISPSVQTMDIGQHFRFDAARIAKYAPRFQASLDAELERVSTFNQ